MQTKPIVTIIAIYICSLWGAHLKAQQLTIKAGINRSDYIMGFYSPVFERVSKLNWGNGIGAKVGAEYSVPLLKFLDADLGMFYAQRRAVMEGQMSAESYETRFTMQYIDIPLNLRLNLKKGNLKWHLRAGILAGVLLHAQQKILLFPLGIAEPKSVNYNQFSIGGPENFKRVDLSSGLGAGVTWKKISLNVDYNQTIGSIVNEPENNNGSFIRWNNWNISFGYLIGT